jgi:hypothetical protein
MWIATPSLQWTFTIYSLPVSTGAPCSDPKLLQPVEQPLDTISVPVGFEVTGGRVFSVGPRRDNGPDPVDQQLLAQSVAVIALVCENQPGLGNRHG